jgi:small subunit ribosomal protein S4
MRALGVNLPGLSDKTIDERPTPPGQHGPRLRRKLTHYAQQLREKQKLRYHYGVTERQMRTIADHAMHSRENTAAALVRALELRLDNIVFRAGFARTIPAARQIVAHGHVTVNGRKLDIPSAQLRRGDTVEVRPGGRDAVRAQQAKGETLARPEWLDVDNDALRIRVAALPDDSAVPFPIEMHLVVEFYSR